MKHIIGFPGLFDSRYVVDRAAFDLGKLIGSDEPIYIYWYGLIIVFAMITAYIYFMIRAKRSEGIIEDHTMNVALFALPLGIVGARAFYVLTNLSRFSSFKEAAFGIRDGGLAIYGGITFGLITVLVYCYIKKINCFKMLDALAPAVMIAQAIGRWGNFFNAEAYGKSTGIEKFFLRMSISDYETPRSVDYVHPTFLYESIWNIVGFIIANILYRKKKINGQIFCFYLFWYGMGRAFIELLRTDSCMIFESFISKDPLDFFGTSYEKGLKAFVYLSIILIILSIVLYIVLKNKQTKENHEISELKIALAEESNCGEESIKAEETNNNETILAEETQQEQDMDSGTDASSNENATETENDEKGSDDYEDGEEGNDDYDE
jgi:phosphatidylglycerol:prolipoprotein diacylglycerol transferase